MKKFLFLAVLAFLVSGLTFAQQIRSGSSAWVSSKEAALKSSTGFFAGTTGTLPMGEEVNVLRINGNWAEVRSRTNSSLTGWTAVSNLSSRRIVAAGTSATATEVALAGKGFNQEIEDAYKADGSLNFADVDRTEAISVSQNELYQFVTEGRLYTGE